MPKMKARDKFGLTFIVLLWVLICWVLIASQPFTLHVLFVVVASAIIVFVPLYKKYFRKKDEQQ